MPAFVHGFILGGAYIASGMMLAAFGDTGEAWRLLVSFVLMLVGNVALHELIRNVWFDATTVKAKPMSEITERES